LTCQVNYSTNQVIKFHISLYTYSACFRSWFSVIFLLRVLIITLFFSFLNTSSLVLFKWEYIIISSFLIIMSSDNHLCTIKEINALNHFSVIFCHYCFSYFCLCIIINDYKKCAECTYCECLCINVLWETLDRVHNKLKSNILKVKFKQSQLLSEQTHVVAKLNCFHKMLQQTNDHVKKKTLCLLQKLFNKKKVINNSSFKTLSQLLNMISFDF